MRKTGTRLCGVGHCLAERIRADGDVVRMHVVQAELAREVCVLLVMADALIEVAECARLAGLVAPESVLHMLAVVAGAEQRPAGRVGRAGVALLSPGDHAVTAGGEVAADLRVPVAACAPHHKDRSTMGPFVGWRDVE